MHDQRGNPVGTASAAALAAHERALWHLVAFYGDPVSALDATIAADPGWGLARTAKATFLLSLTEPSLVPDARALLDAAEPLARGAPARERAHLAAARHAAAGEFGAACAAWGELLLEHPRDLLALLGAHLFDFYRGDARNLRARPARVLPAWEAGDPLRPFVLGMHAFGLEECNLYPQAEAAGREALAADPRGPWAIHAVGHVMEMQGRHDEGTRWLAQTAPDWADNGLRIHLWWHQALFHLERLDIAGALALYDAHLGGAQTVINLNWLDCAALLWRIELLGGDAGARWGALAARWADPVAHAGWYAFNDAHALVALLRSGQTARADALLAAAELRARTGDNRAMAAEVGLPLMRGLRACVQGDDAAAIAALWPLRDVAQRFGGSHAQRDLIDQTLLAAAARSGARALGRALVNERTATRPRTPLAGHWAGRVG
jgi:hypothetical protein